MSGRASERAGNLAAMAREQHARLTHGKNFNSQSQRSMQLQGQAGASGGTNNGKGSNSSDER